MSENGSTTHKTSTKNGHTSPKTSTENSQKSKNLPDRAEYEKALFLHGTHVTGEYIQAHYDDWVVEHQKEAGEEKDFGEEFLQEIKTETCNYVTEEVMEWVKEHGLKEYFDAPFVLRRILGDEEKRRGWFDYWMGRAKSFHNFKHPNERQIARRKAMDKKIISLLDQRKDRKEVAKITGVTVNHVDKVLRRSKNIDGLME